MPSTEPSSSAWNSPWPAASAAGSRSAESDARAGAETTAIRLTVSAEVVEPQRARDEVGVGLAALPDAETGGRRERGERGSRRGVQRLPGG